ncbi:class I SAM-dependent methyltransferase [Geoalkalibacter sp.]|uniref:class I SAM-dependent methyltransferase n=1 Tax=Geoalkalibacter sp. TaxID=3041440 RepID=UPI00272E47B9|nr:class I SAM-dependent methyltransferase [Geoalkalibacter sp.]
MQSEARQDPQGYDFRRCKLCGQQAAEPFCRLTGGTLQVCRHCDFHFLDHLDPLPSGNEEQPRELDEKSWKYISERLGTGEGELPWRLRLVEKYCRLPGAQCLDIGAGVGQFLLLLRAAKANGTGIEPSRLRRLFARREFDLHLEEQTIEAPQWREKYSEYFDVITLWDVIEHVNFPAETLSCAFQLLKPGGALLIDTPSRTVLPYRLSLVAARLSGGRVPLFLSSYYSALPYGHKQIFTPRQLTRLVAQAGFQILTQGAGYDELLGLRPPLLRPRSKIILVARKPVAG